MSARHLALGLVLTLALAGCSRGPAPLAAGAPVGNVAARGLSMAKVVANALDAAKDGNPQGTRRAATVLHALSRGFTLEKSGDLQDYLTIVKGQRGLVPLIAKEGATGASFMAGQINEVRNGYQVMGRVLKGWSTNPEADVDFEHVQLAIDEVLDASMDKLPGETKTPAEAYGYMATARAVMADAASNARGESDVAGMRDALGRAMDRAVKTPGTPKDIVASYAAWVGEYRAFQTKPMPQARLR